MRRPIARVAQCESGRRQWPARIEPATRLAARRRRASAYFVEASSITTRNPMLRKSKPKLSKSGFVAVRFAERQYGAV
jgi:hypothetical protein